MFSNKRAEGVMEGGLMEAYKLLDTNTLYIEGATNFVAVDVLYKDDELKEYRLVSKNKKEINNMDDLLKLKDRSSTIVNSSVLRGYINLIFGVLEPKQSLVNRNREEVFILYDDEEIKRFEVADNTIFYTDSFLLNGYKNIVKGLFYFKKVPRIVPGYNDPIIPKAYKEISRLEAKEKIIEWRDIVYNFNKQANIPTT